jgi:hypothetical protein
MIKFKFSKDYFNDPFKLFGIIDVNLKKRISVCAQSFC